METEWKKRIEKPIGVYIWTVIVFLKFGVVDFLNYFFEIRNAEGNVALPLVVISFGLCVFTAGAAIWALVGLNEGRIALLILLPLNVLWIVLLALSGLFDEEPANDSIAVIVLIRQTFLSLWVIGIEWYFMSKKVVKYYKRNVRN